MNPLKKIKYKDLSCVFCKCCVFHSDHCFIYLTDIYWAPSICQALDLLGNRDSAKKKTGKKKSSSQVAYILLGSPDGSSELGMHKICYPRLGSYGHSQVSQNNPSPVPEELCSGWLMDDLSKPFWPEPERWGRITPTSPVWWRFLLLW